MPSSLPASGFPIKESWNLRLASNPRRSPARGRRYIEVDDQLVLAARMDLDLALQRCVSFRRLLSELEKILIEA
jgi:hypothetical protein